jgi:RIO-like serine/threonine protein kinase
MKVYVDNKEYILEDQYSISGGEGTVYIQNNMAFKIYHEEKNMIPLGKFKELNAIKKNNVIKPEKLIFDIKNNPIGYTMKPVYNTVQLSRVVTTDYQKNHNITHDKLINIIQQIQDTIHSIHNDNCLIVDINDSNILIDESLKVYFIDVDSYQTTNYPATALQDYAKDFKVENNNFTKNSDWFSFGLLSTKILLGIHPYMGRWNKFKKRDLENTLSYRSENNISIFNDNVVYPKTVRSFSFIPKNYYRWFLDIFEKGKRLVPPMELGDFCSTSEQLILNSQTHVTFNKKNNIDYNITNIFNGFREEIIGYNNGFYFQGEYISMTSGKKIVYFNQKDEPIIFKINNFKIESFNIVSKEKRIYDQLEAEELFIFNNNLYAKYEDNFMNLELLNYGQETLTVKQNNTIMKYATSFFENVVYQNTLGKSFFYLVHDKDTLPFVKIKELDSKKIINAKYENKILFVTYQDKQSYINMAFKFNNLFSEYKVIYNEKSDFSDLNFTVNDKGICVFIPNEEKIIICFNHWEADQQREISDSNIQLNMSLFSVGSNINIYLNKEIYQIKLN